MTRRANPYAVRLICRQNWNNYYYPENKRGEGILLKRNKEIRDYFNNLKLDVSGLKIESAKDSININLCVLNTNLVLGSESNRINEILNALYKIINNSSIKVKVNIIGVRNMYSSAQCIANLIASKLERRIRSRMVIREVLSKVGEDRTNKGIKIILKGLIDGRDMAQTDKFFWGKSSLTTIDNDIEVGEKKAITRRGVIGVKVFLNLGKKTIFEPRAFRERNPNFESKSYRPRNF